MVATQATPEEEPNLPQLEPIYLKDSRLIKKEWIVANSRAADNMEQFFEDATDCAVAFEEAHQQDKVEELKTMVKSMLDMQTDCRNRVKALNDLRQELDNGVGVVDPQEWFLKKLKELNNNYKSKPDPDRFRDMEQYQEFRKQVWEATHEGGAPPEEGNVDDEDEDIVISTQKVSLICPITKKLLEDPVMAPGCEHVYSKAAIMQMEVLPNGQTECPVAGCPRRFKKKDLVQPPKRLLKLLEKRKRQLEEGEGMEGGDDEFQAYD